MFEREMMIQGLNKQRKILQELIVELEQRPIAGPVEIDLATQRTQMVSRNLKKLREIKERYLDYLGNASLS